VSAVRLNAAGALPAAAQLRVGYALDQLDVLLTQPDVLAVIGFGDSAPATHADPRYFNIGLQPLASEPGFEVWRVAGSVETGRCGAVAWARDSALSFGSLALAEADFDGIEAAAEAAYSTMLDFIGTSPQPQLLRSWNYIDAITVGDGDGERYRRFCLGRARGMQGRLDNYPAATAIGLRDGQRVLRIYWLAGQHAGTNIENPRQVAAYHYPRQYGPQPPSFSRATLAAAEGIPLLLSGTASVVGHASLHADDIVAQVQETFRNFASLLQSARQQRDALPSALGESSLLKIYVRDAQDVAVLLDELAKLLPDATPRLLLAAEICRRELRVEIDGFHS
jgi:chorismate lyase/3-hydroxybenzoate synthase